MNKRESTPIVLANTEWMPPEKLLNEVNSERMIRGLLSFAKSELQEESVGDAECLAYLMPQIGRAPLPRGWTEIYCYLAGRVLKRWNQYEAFPEDCRVEKLDDYSENKLKDLREWIYKSRGGEIKNPVINALKEVFSEAPKKQIIN